MSTEYQALRTPPAALERGGVEVLRCAIIDGELHVTLRPAFDDPRGWGRLFAEVARQVAGAYAQAHGFTQHDTLARIGAAFEQEMQAPPETQSSIAPLG
jgi:hypothetical protein